MKTTIELPLLPLRDVVVYPHMVIPLFVGREKSIEALEAAMTGDKQILLLAQKNPADDDPGEDALYRVGTIATVLQLLKLPDGTVKVLVEGEQRGAVERFMEVDGHLRAEVALIEEVEARSVNPRCSCAACCRSSSNMCSWARKSRLKSCLRSTALMNRAAWSTPWLHTWR